MIATCSLCLEQVDGKDRAQLQVCSHEFCRACLGKWFETSGPDCRGNVEQTDVVAILGKPWMQNKQGADIGNAWGVDEFTLAWLQAHDARQCPKCGSWIERSRGCDHMRCHCRCIFDFDIALKAKDWDGQSPPLVAAIQAKRHRTIDQQLRELDRAGAEQRTTELQEALLLVLKANGPYGIAGQLERRMDPSTNSTFYDRYTTEVHEFVALACRNGIHEKFHAIMRLFPAMDRALATLEYRGAPLLYHAYCGGNLDTIKYLVDLGATPGTREECFNYLVKTVALACIDGDFATMRCLFCFSPNLFTAEYEGHSLLYHACQAGNLEIVQYLLARGAIADVRELRYDKWSLTEAMALACYEGNLPQIKWMLRLFPALRTTEYEGKRPCDHAVAGGQTTVVELLSRATLNEARRVAVARQSGGR